MEIKVICGVDVIATGLNIDYSIVSSTQEMTQFHSIFDGSCIVCLIVAGSYGKEIISLLFPVMSVANSIWLYMVSPNKAEMSFCR